MKRQLLVAAFSAGLTASVHATTIDTLASENSHIQPWGLPDTSAYGQTFTLASTADLNSVLFRINDGGTAMSYDMHIFSWSGGMASGASLASVSGSTAGVNSMSDVTTSVGALALAAGDYVAFLQATSLGGSQWGSVSSLDVYAGGAFVFQNNSGDTSLWTTSGWTANWEGAGSDLAFKMEFGNSISDVPATATLPLLATGLGLMFGFRRRK